MDCSNIQLRIFNNYRDVWHTYNEDFSDGPDAVQTSRCRGLFCSVYIYLSSEIASVTQLVGRDFRRVLVDINIMTKPLPSTPSRRSQRFQPTATPTSKGIDKNILECAWASEPVFVRRTIPEIDILPEERDEESEDPDENEETERLSETVFYNAFRMRRKATAYRGSKSMKLGKTETITYKVGDTVMVETDTLYIMKRPPSIGVIVAMWETRKEEDSDTLTDASSMRIRIHWFLRPSELASIRAKREHDDVSTYVIVFENN